MCQRTMIERPKMGFSVPIADWLRGSAAANGLATCWLKGGIRDAGFFEPRAIGRAWEEHQTGSKNWEEPLWAALMFEAWREAL